MGMLPNLNVKKIDRNSLGIEILFNKISPFENRLERKKQGNLLKTSSHSNTPFRNLNNNLGKISK